MGSYWEKMTPEERSAEMRKRRLKGKRNGKNGKRGKAARPAKGKYKCSQCGKQFKNQYKLANHVRYDHPKGKEALNGSGAEAEVEKHCWYLFGKVETITDLYSASSGVPRAALTRGLARLLRD